MFDWVLKLYYGQSYLIRGGVNWPLFFFKTFVLVFYFNSSRENATDSLKLTLICSKKILYNWPL